MYDTYQIKFGDTIDSIASKYGISKEELLKINDNKLMGVGSYIVIPVNKDYYMKYTVSNGDTLYSISKNYSVPLDILLSVNGFDNDDYIYPGEEIKIPNTNYNFYIVKENDTLNDITKFIRFEDLKKYNDNLYIVPNQIIVFSRSN